MKTNTKRLMEGNSVDSIRDPAIMTPEEVARFFRKSLSWVYRNRKDLGGRKLGGSLFFPAKEDLYERLFCNEDNLQVVCKSCHKKKSVAENKLRRKTKRPMR